MTSNSNLENYLVHMYLICGIKFWFQPRSKCEVQSEVQTKWSPKCNTKGLFNSHFQNCCQKIVGRWFFSIFGYNEDKNTTYLTQIDFKMINCWLPVPCYNNYYSNNNTAILTPTTTTTAKATNTSTPTTISTTTALFQNQFVSNNVIFLS